MPFAPGMRSHTRRGKQQRQLFSCTQQSNTILHSYTHVGANGGRGQRTAACARYDVKDMNRTGTVCSRRMCRIINDYIV